MINCTTWIVSRISRKSRLLFFTIGNLLLSGESSSLMRNKWTTNGWFSQWIATRCSRNGRGACFSSTYWQSFPKNIQKYIMKSISTKTKPKLITFIWDIFLNSKVNTTSSTSPSIPKSMEELQTDPEARFNIVCGGLRRLVPQFK